VPLVWLLAPWLAVSVACGDHFTCALTRGGTVECWGGNATSELGDGTTRQSGVPVAVSGLGGVTQLGAGTHACASSGGRLYC